MTGHPDVIVGAAIEAAFEELLNTRHLYQPVRLKWEELEPMIDQSHELGDRWITLGRDLVMRLPWTFIWEKSAKGRVRFGLRPIATFCKRCEQRQPHNPCTGDQAPASIDLTSGQVFVIPLQCQGCRHDHVVFLVSRNGPELRLTGRSIFETLEVPDYVPASLHGFYSQALIAFNCNQTLPALFMLRTVVEQHMRSETNGAEIEEVSKLCELYAGKLDEAFKQRFPSLTDIYAKLSTALHRANADDALFKSEVERIGLHFRGKHAFEQAVKFRTAQTESK